MPGAQAGSRLGSWRRSTARRRRCAPGFRKCITTRAGHSEMRNRDARPCPPPPSCAVRYGALSLCISECRAAHVGRLSRERRTARYGSLSVCISECRAARVGGSAVARAAHGVHDGRERGGATGARGGGTGGAAGRARCVARSNGRVMRCVVPAAASALLRGLFIVNPLF